MKSIKCDKCGFVGWAESKNCKKCKSDLSTTTLKANPAATVNQGTIRKPSITAIIANEPLVVIVGIIFPLIMWGIYIAMNVFDVTFTSSRSDTVISPDESGGQIYLPIGFTILGLIVSILRISYIYNIFKNGVETVGEILEISFVKDRGNIVYSYLWNGHRLKGYSGIMKNSRTENLQEGQQVSVIINALKPKRSVPTDLYC